MSWSAGVHIRAGVIAVDGNRALHELDDGQAIWMRHAHAPETGRRGVVKRDSRPIEAEDPTPSMLDPGCPAT
jgi:hypothetical protein